MRIEYLMLVFQSQDRALNSDAYILCVQYEGGAGYQELVRWIQECDTWSLITIIPIWTTQSFLPAPSHRPEPTIPTGGQPPNMLINTEWIQKQFEAQVGL